MKIQEIITEKCQDRGLPLSIKADRLTQNGSLEPDLGADLPGELATLTQNVIKELVNLAGAGPVKSISTYALNHMYWLEGETFTHHVMKSVPLIPRQFIPDVPPDSMEHHQFLAQIPLFSQLTPTDRHELMGSLMLRHYEDREDVIRQGEPGDEFFIVLSGRAAVHVADHSGLEALVAWLDRGDCFGEIALLENVPRTATVRASGPLKVLCLSSEDFVQVLDRAQHARKLVIPLIRYGTFLSRVPLFRNLTPTRLFSVAQRLREEYVSASVDIIQEGEAGDHFYLIKEGQLEVSHRGKTVASLGPGDYFGEIALLTHEPRSATVRTLTDCVLLSLSKKDFYLEFSNFLDTLSSLGDLANQRLAKLHQIDAV